jgi:NAD(P)-dependent dehydrogenase (short-subunit alcohol dehydrogenase family)
MAVPQQDLLTLAQIRRQVSQVRGAPMLAQLDARPEAAGFSQLPEVADIATRGPITPDHVIRTKAVPVILSGEIKTAITDYARDYQAYFDRHTSGPLTCLDPAPRWAVWPGYGTIAFEQSLQAAQIITDVIEHTRRAIQMGEALGGWQPLDAANLFAMEYWELEQAKLGKVRAPAEFQGKIALVTGAASGIGLACAQHLHRQGAVVVGLDIHPSIQEQLNQPGYLGIEADVTDAAALQLAVETTVQRFGGLDILVGNAGIFTQGQPLETLDSALWQKSLAINLTSQQRLLQIAIPYLKQGLDPAVVLIASRNVRAPGPGAAAYSVAKAGLTQLARVAALELAADGIRVNVVHPDCVYDTGLWTPEVLARRAQQYGISVEAYKTRNLLKQPVTAQEVARLVGAMAGPTFAKTTGAQVPIDGGNERVI